MSDPTTTNPETAERHGTHPAQSSTTPVRTHSVHVRGVPEEAWRRSRQMALQSGMTYREFVTRLLAASTPLSREPHAGHEEPAT